MLRLAGFTSVLLLEFPMDRHCGPRPFGRGDYHELNVAGTAAPWSRPSRWTTDPAG
jgi:hypothetical protein